MRQELLLQLTAEHAYLQTRKDKVQHGDLLYKEQAGTVPIVAARLADTVDRLEEFLLAAAEPQGQRASQAVAHRKQ